MFTLADCHVCGSFFITPGHCAICGAFALNINGKEKHYDVCTGRRLERGISTKRSSFAAPINARVGNVAREKLTARLVGISQSET